MPPLAKKATAEEFDWEQIGTGGAQSRLIRIPVDSLLAGDPKYNIVIRPGDGIHIPVDIIGEFLVQGNVNNQGFINITGRPITLKMAIAAAGGLGPLAWPKRCEVIRRIGKDKEEIVMVDLDKIARGEQPDFFIKPNDLINVGTHPTSRWHSVEKRLQSYIRFWICLRQKFCRQRLWRRHNTILLLKGFRELLLIISRSRKSDSVSRHGYVSDI